MAEFIGTLFLRPTAAALAALRADPLLCAHSYHLTPLPDSDDGVRLPAEGILLIDGVWDDPRRPIDDDDDEEEDDDDDDPGERLLEPSRHFAVDGAGITVGPDPFDPDLGMVMPPARFLGWMQQRAVEWGTPIHHYEQHLWGDALSYESYWACDADGCRGYIGVDADDWTAFEWDGNRFTASARKWIEEPWIAFGCSERVHFYEETFPRERYRLRPSG